MADTKEYIVTVKTESARYVVHGTNIQASDSVILIHSDEKKCYAAAFPVSEVVSVVERSSFTREEASAG